MDIYEWKLSAKGNSYTEIDGLNCVVGKNKFGSFFGLVDGEFLPQAFSSLDEAKDAEIGQKKVRRVMNYHEGDDYDKGYRWTSIKVGNERTEFKLLDPPLVLKLLTLPAILAVLATLAHLSSYLGLAGHASRVGHCSISCVPLNAKS